MIFKYLVSGIIFISIFFACTSTVPVKLRKPAELNVGSARTLAVLDFDFTGSVDFEQAESKERPGGARLTRNVKAILHQKFDQKNSYPGKNITQQLVAKLVQNEYYTVIERSKIEALMEEQALSLSGMINEDKAVEVGNLIGAQAMITGSGLYSVKDEGAWEKYTEEEKVDGKKVKVEKERYGIFRNVNVELTFRIIDVARGVVIASKTNRASNSGQRNSNKTYGPDETKAAEKLNDWKPAVDNLVNNILDQTIRQIAPHTVTEQREIEEGESDKMERSVELAKRDLWDDAKKIWEEVLNKKGSEKEDRIAATYNIGLYYEIYGFLDDAEQWYQKAYNLSKDSKYLDARARINQRRQELIKLYQQESSL
jgi:curli biogenesis system outer membrane secretion channel CsgG